MLAAICRIFRQGLLDGFFDRTFAISGVKFNFTRERLLLSRSFLNYLVVLLHEFENVIEVPGRIRVFFLGRYLA